MELPARKAVAIAGTLCLCVLAVLGWQFYFSSPRFNPQKLAIAEDEVYEVVVRHMPAEGAKLLAFDPEALTHLFPGMAAETCGKEIRTTVWGYAPATHANDSFIGKLYKTIISRDFEGWLASNTINDFAERLCKPSNIPTAFHTDLPRVFLPANQLKVRPAGANGIISLSRVGFDRTLHEAIVSTSFVCGGLCGEGWIYILKKQHGVWRVVEEHWTWVS